MREIVYKHAGDAGLTKDADVSALLKSNWLTISNDTLCFSMFDCKCYFVTTIKNINEPH